MNYYKLMCDIKGNNCTEIYFKDEEHPIIGTYPDYYIKERSPISFTCPYSIEELSDFARNCGCWLLFSDTLYKIIKPYGKQNLLVGDAHIYGQKSNNFKKYHLIHLKRDVVAINKTETKYYEFIDQHQVERIVNHSTLVLMKAKLVNKHIFRVKELPGPYYVSEQLKDEIESSKITGVEFLPVASK